MKCLGRFVLLCGLVAVVSSAEGAPKAAEGVSARAALEAVTGLRAEFDRDRSDAKLDTSKMPDADLAAQIAMLQDVAAVAAADDSAKIFDKYLHPFTQWQLARSYVSKVIRDQPATVLPKQVEDLVADIGPMLKTEADAGIASFDPTREIVLWAVRHDAASASTRARDDFKTAWFERQDEDQPRRGEALRAVSESVKNDDGQRAYRKQATVMYDPAFGFVTRSTTKERPVVLARYGGRWMLVEW